MKNRISQWLALWVAFTVAVDAQAQGHVSFKRAMPASRMPVFDLEVGYTPLTTTNFLLEMYGGPANTPEGLLEPLGAPITFGPFPGIFAAGTRTVPGVTPGGYATVQLRAWTAHSGATYQEAALQAIGTRSIEHRIGRSVTMQVRTGGFLPEQTPIPPGPLSGLQMFAIGPWPGWPAVRFPSLVVNGDFNGASIAGWTGGVVNGAFIGSVNGAFGTSGDWISFEGALEQNLSATSTYLLSFATRGGELRAFWGDVFLGAFRSPSAWQNPRFVVTARTTPTRLRFEGTGAALLDFVRVLAAPSNQPIVELSAPIADTLYYVGDPIPLRAAPVASHERTIARVEFLLDGSQVIATATNSPWHTSWSATVPNTSYIFARVIDDAGTATYSHGVRIRVRGNPEVSWQAPGEGAVYFPRQNIDLVAAVSGNYGEITHVDFYAESNLLATVPAPSNIVVNAVWTNAPLGNHRLSAVARGATGRVNTAYREIYVTRLAVPDQYQQDRSARISVRRDFSVAQTFAPAMSGRLQRIQLWVVPDDSFDGAALQISIVDTQDGVPGTHVLGTATVHSPWRATGGSFAVYFPPNQILLRAEQSYAIVLASETASSPGITFHSSSRSTSYTRGVLWARADDGPWETNASASASLHFSTHMIPPVRPVVTWVSPAEGLVAPENATVLIHAQAADEDDDITNFALYQNDILFATGASPTITFLWTNIPPGNWILTARATDALGHEGVATTAMHVGTTGGLPTLTVEDTTALEGQATQSLARFVLHLSAPSTNEVSVDYATHDGTAEASVDYPGSTGRITFPPETTTATIVVPTMDDAIDETEESFYLQLSRPQNAVVLRSQAVATILDDEFLPGELHHFVWGSTPAVVLTRQPFAARLEARDLNDMTATSFHGAARIRGILQPVTNRTILNASTPTPIVAAGQWTAGYAFTPRSNLVVTAFRSFFGTNVTLTRGDGSLLAFVPATSAGLAWRVLPLSQPVLLEANRPYRLYASSGGQAVYGREDQPPTFGHGTIDAAYLNPDENQGTNHSNLRWPAIDLRYTVGTPIPIEPAQAVGFDEGVWTGMVSVPQGVGYVLLQAEEGFGRVGVSHPIILNGRSADISLTQTALTPLVTQGDPASCLMVVSNAGPATANDVVVSNSLPGDVPLLFVLTSQGTTTNMPASVRWNVGSLPARASATLQLTLGPTNYGTIGCTSSVAATEPDPVPGDREARTSIVVNGRPRAEAGADQLAECTGPGTAVRLDGSLSADVDGDGLSFRWREIDVVLGTNAVLETFLSAGTHSLELEVLDARGASAADVVQVQVLDRLPPVLACPTSPVAECSSPLGTMIMFQATAFDACEGAIVVACLPPSGFSLPPGITPVTCSAADRSGNSNQCSFIVTVRDTTAPVLQCPTHITAAFEGLTGAVVNFLPSAADACSAVTALCMPPGGTLFPIGTNEVHCISHDTSSNQVSCSFAVSVLGARGTHRGVLDDLTALSDTITNRPDADRVRDALGDLGTALEADRWLDEVRAHPKRGEAIFKNDKEVVKSLLELSDGRNLGTAEVWLDWVRRLVRSDRLLAEAAIANATRATSDARHIGKAKEELARGDVEALEGKFREAIERYFQAWKRASHLHVGRARGSADRIVLRFNGAPRALYAVETSTNLIDWVEIEVRQSDPDGVIEFEQDDISRRPSRFFRLEAR